MEHHYTAFGGSYGIGDGDDTAILTVQNKASSPFILKIKRILLMTAPLTAVTGVGIQIDVCRLTAVTESGGAAGALTAMDDNADTTGEIATYVSVYTGATTFTVGDIVAYRGVNNDEVSLTGQADVVQRPIWTPADPEHPLIIKPTQAVAIIQRTDSEVGGWLPQIDFSIQR